MIEYLSFGEGFRLDGPNWGRLARRFLEEPNRWRVLKPGIHFLDNPGFNLYNHRLVVDEAGRGSLSITKDPRLVAATSKTAPLLTASVLMKEAFLLNLPIDEEPEHRGFALRNVSVPEAQQHLHQTQDPTLLRQVTRLTGLIRYNA